MQSGERIGAMTAIPMSRFPNAASGMPMLMQSKRKVGSHAKYLLATKMLIGQRAPVIPAMRIFLFVVAALMFSAPWAHAGMPLASELTSSDVAVHCTDDAAAVCDDTLDHHGANEDEGQLCCSMSCHEGVQPCFDHAAFLALTKTAHIVDPARDMVRAFVTNLERPPRLG